MLPSNRMKPTMQVGINSGDLADDDEDIVIVSEKKIRNGTRKKRKMEQGVVGLSSIHENVLVSGIPQQRAGQFARSQ